jgi:alanine racemase
VAGAVTMDMTMLDVTDTPCAVGDVVTLIGRDGDDVITVQDAARSGHLSPYELLTELHSRLPRLYGDHA